MSCPFYDNTVQAQFHRDGVVQGSFLSPKEVSLLTEIYISSAGGRTDRSFHSTMFINDAAYRQQTDAALRRLLEDKLHQVLQAHRLLFVNFIVKEAAADTSVGVHQDWSFTPPPKTRSIFGYHWWILPLAPDCFMP